MNQAYSRLAREATIELHEQKSRFIAIGRPVATEAEAIEFLASVRSTYPDASHHVYAYSLCIDQFQQRFSDDGEPSGTAGKPVLNVLLKSGISQSIIVVVRYFGGILLGSGGLIRAYGRSAALLVQETGIENLTPCRQFRVTLPYSDFDSAMRMLPALGAQVTNTRFALDAELIVSVPIEQESSFLYQITELTRDGALIESTGDGYIREIAVFNIASEQNE
jgi:uncharacterized YigZ family protein